MEGRPRTEGRVTSSPPPLSATRRGQKSCPRLYLVTPRLADAAALAREVGDAIAAGDVAAVLVRLDPSDERTLIKRVKAIADTVQRRDTALLLDGYPEIVARAGADGAHLTGVPALTAALDALKPDRIAGAGGLRSRHDAMLAGEAGADYVMFGEPDRLGVRPPLDALVERLSGGRKSSSHPASAMPQAWTRSRRSRKLARISSRSVTGYGRMHKAPPQR
jgi:Thiamine monophosphate synthase